MTKKTLILHFIAALLAVLLSCHGSSFAARANDEQAEETLVKLESGTQYEIANVDEEFTVRVPVTLRPGIGAVKPLLIDAALGNMHDQKLAQSFNVGMENIPKGENRAPALMIVVKTKDLRQGKYRLLINFLPADDSSANNPQANVTPSSTGESVSREKSAAPKNQFVTLELTLPAARLHAPATMIVERTIYPWGAYIKEDSALVLREMSGQQTRLTNLEAKQIEISGGATANNSAPALNFAAPTDAIAPTKTGKFSVASANNFPLGNTTGIALVTSPQLAESLLVNFEVRSRRSVWHIPVIIFFGIGLGFIARVWAQRQIDLYNARSKADDAIKTLKQEQHRHADAAFQKKIQDIIESLTAARNGRKTDLIAAEITKAETDSATALQELDKERAVAIARLENLSKLAALRHSLPQKIATVFEIETVLDEARKLIALDNVGESKRMLGDLTAQTSDRFNEQVLGWIAESKSFLTGLDSLAPLSATASDNFSQAIAGLSAKFDAITFTANDATPENILATVNEIRSSRLKFRQLLLETHFLISDTISLYKTQFAQADKADEASLKELFEKLDAFSLKCAGWTQTGSDVPPSSVQENVNDLKISWRKALLKQVNADTDTKTSVGNLLDQEQYRAATAATIKFLREKQTDTKLGDDDTLHGTRTNRAGEIVFPNAAFAAGRGAAEAIGASPLIFNVFLERTLPPIFDYFSSGSLSNYVLASLLRFAVAGIGIIAAGYVLFADKFVGTASDLLAVFVWAFALDVSVNTFLEASSGAKNKA